MILKRAKSRVTELKRILETPREVLKSELKGLEEYIKQKEQEVLK